MSELPNCGPSCCVIRWQCRPAWACSYAGDNLCCSARVSMQESAVACEDVAARYHSMCEWRCGCRCATAWVHRAVLALAAAVAWVHRDGPAGRRVRAMLADVAVPRARPPPPHRLKHAARIRELACVDSVHATFHMAGMHADSDGDGTPDCEDACPTDANKVVPGRCGCSEEDTTPCP